MKDITTDEFCTIIEKITEILSVDELINEFVKILYNIFPIVKISLYELSKERLFSGTKTYQTLAYDILDKNSHSIIIENNLDMQLCMENKKIVELKLKDKSKKDFLYPLIEFRETTYILYFMIETTELNYLNKINSLTKIISNQLALLHEKDRDFLTGLYNRQYYNKIILSLNKSKRIFTHLVMLDIDYFKNVNDQFGHLIGDEVLIHFSNRIKRIFRRDDCKIRYGGEEFLILLKMVSNQEVEELLERFRKEIESYTFPLIEKLTVSIGYTEIISEDDPSTSCEKADKALYYAKDHGRNQVCSYINYIKMKPPGISDIHSGITIWD